MCARVCRRPRDKGTGSGAGWSRSGGRSGLAEERAGSAAGGRASPPAPPPARQSSPAPGPSPPSDRPLEKFCPGSAAVPGCPSASACHGRCPPGPPSPALGQGAEEREGAEPVWAGARRGAERRSEARCAREARRWRVRSGRRAGRASGVGGAPRSRARDVSPSLRHGGGCPRRRAPLPGCQPAPGSPALRR